jgi:hypothetical protein
VGGAPLLQHTEETARARQTTAMRLELRVRCRLRREDKLRALNRALQDGTRS